MLSIAAERKVYEELYEDFLWDCGDIVLDVVAAGRVGVVTAQWTLSTVQSSVPSFCAAASDLPVVRPSKSRVILELRSNCKVLFVLPAPPVGRSGLAAISCCTVAVGTAGGAPW